ncbi:hypothetical protein ACFMPD_04260 [Sedimentitalea sp. HM32M-2]|uniref:hypothetical protein n=1 Tax=Sedimentitalea sp. HM32M-2 TaxID=3351566 RepID=UPI00364233FA
MFEVLMLMISVVVQSAGEIAGSAGAASQLAQPAVQQTPADESNQMGLAEDVAVTAPDATPDGSEQQAEQAPEPVAPPAFLTPAEPQLVAEPQVPTGKFTTALEVKPILNATRGNWITVREFNGRDLLYVTHLWSWRCGLLELRVGLNGNPPEPWPLPECHLDAATPAAILETDGLPYRDFQQGSIAMIEVQITYDDLTTDRAKYNRQGIQIP